jgi:hypothetical protein
VWLCLKRQERLDAAGQATCSRYFLSLPGSPGQAWIELSKISSQSLPVTSSSIQLYLLSVSHSPLPSQRRSKDLTLQARLQHQPQPLGLFYSAVIPTMTRLRASTAFGRRLLPVLFLVASLLSLAEAARQPYPISLSDQSPSITYTPSVLGASSGWNVSYSQSPWSSFNSGQTNLGKGASSHWTNYSGAVISFSFVGTGFTAYGDTSGNMTSILQLDGSTISTVQNKVMSTRPTLASATNLQEGYHTVSLTTKGTGGVEFDGVDLVLGSGAVK